MTASIWAEDFPSPRHDARCAIWVSTSGPCSCRGRDGHDQHITLAARLDLVLPVELACDNDIEEEAS